MKSPERRGEALHNGLQKQTTITQGPCRVQGVRVDPSAHQRNNKMFVCQAVFGKQRKHGFKRLWVSELDACPDDDELADRAMRMQSKQEAARTPLVRMRATLRLQYYIMNVLKAKILAGKKRASEAS